MKHLCSILVTVILVATFLLTSCAAPTPAPSPVPTPAPVQTVKLRFAIHEPPVSPAAKIYAEWASKIKEQTNGRVEIVCYPAQSLVKSQDMYSSTIGGVCDIAAWLTPLDTGIFPLNGILMQPFGAPPFQDGIDLWTELYNKFPAMKAELAQVHLLFTWVPSNFVMHFTKKQVKVPDDIKGMKILTMTPTSIEVFKLAGATPVPTPTPEMYMGLERGLAEGVDVPYDALRIFGLTRIVRHHLEVPLGAPQCFIIMNSSKWNSLSPGDQKIIMGLSPWVSEVECKAAEEQMESVKKQAVGMNHTLYVPTAEEYKLWSDLFPKAAEKWITDEEAKGRPARALYQEAARLAEKYHK